MIIQYDQIALGLIIAQIILSIAFYFLQKAFSKQTRLMENSLKKLNIINNELDKIRTEIKTSQANITGYIYQVYNQSNSGKIIAYSPINKTEIRKGYAYSPNEDIDYIMSGKKVEQFD